MYDELFVTNKTGILLKSKEFNEPCIARFNKGKFQMNRLGEWYKHNIGEIEKQYIAAPLYSQVENWLETKGYYIDVFEEFGNWILMFYTYREEMLSDTITDKTMNKIETWKHKGPYKTKNEAKEKGIQEILKLI